jgi:hypothetical protein
MREYQPKMVRLVSLAAVVGACWLCAPAQADTLPVQPPAAAVNTAAQVVNTVRPVVTQVTTSAPASAPAEVTIRKATAAAKPAVEAAVTTTVQVAPGRVDGNGGLRVGASSLRRAPSARLRRPEPAAGAPAHRTAAHTDRRDARSSSGQPRAVHPTQPAHPAGAQSGVAPQHPLPAPFADGGVAAGGAGGTAAGLALLAVALLVAAPRLSRRIRIEVSAPRPFTFVALLERPG